MSSPPDPVDDETLRLAFELAPLAIAIIAPDGTYRRVNSAFLEMLGYTEPELLGRPFLDFTHPDIRARDANVFEQIKRGELSRCRFTKRQMHKDGHVVETTVHIAAVREHSEKPAFMLAHFEDVTTATREAEALAQRAAMLETVRRIGEEREVLLREIHHRVKNNLQVISSLLNLQARQTSDMPTRAAIEDAQSRVRSIAVIHEMLYQTPDLARVDMNEYVERLARLLSHSFGARDVALEVHCEKVVLPVDHAVPCGLILNELLTNAFKYAFRPTGLTGARIVVTMAREDHELLLTVADNGVGLPASIDPRTTTTLGMSLLRMLAQQLRGRLDATVDGGTSVRVRFPVEH
jgi:PAS domain S-box-containing protein